MSFGPAKSAVIAAFALASAVAAFEACSAFGSSDVVASDGGVSANGGDASSTIDAGSSVDAGNAGDASDAGTDTGVVALGPCDGGAHRYMFVTSTLFDGNLADAGGGGIEGATDICNSLAAAAGLTGTYVPWLSTTIAGPALKLEPKTPIITPNCGIIATDLPDLESTGPEIAINVTELGTAIPDSPCAVWTATTAAGAPAAAGYPTSYTCYDFTSNSDAGEFALIGDCALNEDAGGSAWTYYDHAQCYIKAARLYCIQN
jgi:hypothetical protein